MKERLGKINSKNKIFLIIIMLLLIVVGISFALDSFDVNLLGRRNIKISNCEIDLNFKETDELMLVSKYPITQTEALKYEGKTITLKNNSTCETVHFKINIVDKIATTVNKNIIKYQLVNKQTNSETISSNPDTFLIEDTLTQNQEKSYEIRLWISDTATNNDLYENGDSTKPIPYKVSLNLEVSDAVITGISVKTPPTKTEYKEKEVFNPSGMVVVQNYSNGEEKVITDYTISPTTELTTNDTTITISYNGYTTIQNITVKKAGVDALTFAQSKVGTGGLQQVTHAADSTLQITQAVTEYRYRGASSSVNNYVYFNCSDLNNQSSSTCETWRIIGVFPTDDGTGKIENRIKIIKPTSLGNMYWDEGNSNNWASPTTLNTYLNSTYYNTLSAGSKSMIGPTKYYLGGYNGAPQITADVMWQCERKISGSTYYYNNNPNSHTNKIAIMYASDYGYAVEGCDNINLYSGSASDTNDIRMCKDKNWLFGGVNEWVLPQCTSGAGNALFAQPAGNILYGLSYFVGSFNYAIRPVLSLSSNVMIVDGTGAPNSPYKLGI